MKLYRIDHQQTTITEVARPAASNLDADGKDITGTSHFLTWDLGAGLSKGEKMKHNIFHVVRS